MKTLCIGICVSIFLLSSCGEPISQESTDITETPDPDAAVEVVEENNASKGYNEVLAKQLGADEYGMKSYVVAFLKSGPNRDMSEEKALKLQMSHLDNIQRLANEGKLVIAGPFMGAGDLKGIYIFNVETLEEAKALTESDPAIQQGSLEMELYKWYGSAALQEINKIHYTLMAKSFTE